MIIKSTTRKQGSFRQLITYVLNKDQDEIGFVLTHNLKGNTVDEWVQEFQKNESFRRRKRSNSVILGHEILSWHKFDNAFISLDSLKSMTEAYIQKRNPNGIYLAVAHINEEKHYHVHLVVSGVAYRSGESMRMSRGEFSKLKKTMEIYQRKYFPKLAFSQVDHGSDMPYQKDREYQAKRRSSQSSKRERLAKLVKEEIAKSSSLHHFFKTLAERNIELYYRRNRPTGVIWNGRKYRFRTLGVDINAFERAKGISKDHSPPLGK